jgi:hypothetical protein
MQKQLKYYSTELTISWLRRSRVVTSLLVFVLYLCIPAKSIVAQEISGFVATETRVFPQSPLDDQQAGTGLSVVLKPEFYVDWAQGTQSLLFVPFFRLDQHDENRTHWDIRELFWRTYGDWWELVVGFRQVFWGVTESQHLVDVINQTDFVENIDGEQKLGQPTVHFAIINDLGILELFLLTGFRERTFPSMSGRLRFPIRIDTDGTTYESSQGKKHIDLAARYTQSFGPIDLGLSYFHGTSREPRFFADISNPQDPVFTPHYDQIHQGGLDVQYTGGPWLWKLEAIARSSQQYRLYAATGGFEYTFSNISNSGIDLGLISEYLYNYGDQIFFPFNPFSHHLFVGSRMAFNDVQSTDILVGGIINSKNGSAFIIVEAGRRFGDAWKLTFELRGFGQVTSTDYFYAFRRDTHLRLEIARFF